MVFSEEEKDRIRAKLSNRINDGDELIVVSEEERSQSQNRALALNRLYALVADAIKISQKRRPTRPTRASKLKRLESKKIRARIKSGRQRVIDGEIFPRSI